MAFREDIYRDALQRIVDPGTWEEDGCRVCGSQDWIDPDASLIAHAPDCVVAIAAEALSYGQVFPRAPRS